MPALVGGRYEIVRELGRGGMGEVLLARQTNLGRLVVIKRVPPDHPAKHVRALLAEARLAARLHHPCIVSVLDVSADDEPPFVAMEYVAGVTLREMLERAPDGLPVPIALVVAIEVLRGLAYAHGVRSGTSIGVVHRDVKPRNIMVTFAGDVKLIDFGISRALEDTGAWESTSISGTRGYMAPEQQAGVRVDGRADQYAVGVTLREMLTGTSPVDGDATADLSALPAPRAPTPLDDPELAAIVERACGRAPDLRYPDCADLAAALEAYAAAHGGAATPTQVERWMHDHLAARIARWEREAQRASESDLGDPAPDTEARSLQPTLDESSSRPPRDRTAPTVSSGEQVPGTRRFVARRRAWWLAAAAAGLVAAGGGALAWHLRGEEGERAPVAAGNAAVVAIAATNLGSADDAWLAPAVAHLGERALRDDGGRRFALAAEGEPGARRIELAYRATGAGIHVDARAAGSLVAAADGASVAEAVVRLAPALAAALSSGLPPLAPTAAEAADMARLAARDFAEYREFRMLYERARLAGWLDSSAIAAAYEKLVAADPAWARPYGELHWLYGTVTDRSAKAVTDAHAHADATRDPAGLAIVDSLDLVSRHRDAEAIARLAPIYARDDGDMLAGETYYAALDHVDRDAEANAVFQRLSDHYPALYFTGDLITNLEAQGRDDEAEALAKRAFAAYPDNLTAARELARVTAQRGDLAAAQVIAHRMQLVHGDDPVAAAELFDALLVSDDMLGAQRVADRMLLGTPLVRARGRYRAATIAVMQGRFAAAYEQLQRALVDFEPFGREAETPQCLGMLRAVAPLVGEPAAGARYAEQLAAWFDGDEAGSSSNGAVVRYQLALAARGAHAACPHLADGKLDASERAAARFGGSRFAAIAGCAACKDVVAAGLQSSEEDPASLIAFGQCALREHEAALAGRAFAQASRLWSSWDNHEASPYFATLAYFYLGAAAVAAGDHAAARTHYARFLHYWGRADRAIPEVHDAERALAALPP